MRAWRAEIRVRENLPDPDGRAATAALADVGLELDGPVRSGRGYLLGEQLTRDQVQAFVADVLADPISDEYSILAPDESAPPTARARVSIVPLPGVTDHVAHSVQKALGDADLPVVAAGTYRFYEAPTGTAADRLAHAAELSLANEVIQRVLVDEVPTGLPGAGATPDLDPHEVAIRQADDAGLRRVSEAGLLALTVDEMRVIQGHYRELGREPRQLELETLAQTWSEHCKHKTLTGAIQFGGQRIGNLLAETIAHVTHTLDRDFCVSVFEDNAGIVDFDGEDCVCIKVETHNHPSAIEPFGGAGTGVGGVIRDVLGTGLGARPIANTDVFCFAPVDMPDADVPKGCMHPMRLMKGVVAGVRDYGNPMGIPTVNGSIHFDPDFVGNPLVYVGNVGILPRDKAFKKANPGDAVLAIGGKTGRDGIHGATFSSLELHTDSETQSSGAVQIGDPITERVVMDVVLRLRDEDLFSAITDCGAGGFSSAVGEMAEGLGADVDMAVVPLKYQGLAPWEIWVSEAQERMVFAVPQKDLERALEVCAEEGCEATVLGEFNDSGRLVVRHGAVVHGDLDLEFMHDGLPKQEREAIWREPELADPDLPDETDCGAAVLRALSDLNVASKEWVIRQYDHEVQAGSAGKPLCGTHRDGPADAAVIAPKLGSVRGVVLANGLNPRYSRIDPAAMAECALDEAMRNLVAAGGDPDRTCVLDNYCWGNTSKPEQLGGLVRASLALRDLALAYRTPFVSGKDSLNNEFNAGDRTIAIPGCILVTAMSVIPDVGRTLTSALRRAGNELWLVGVTKRELGGSVYWKQRGELGRSVPRVDAELGKSVLEGVHRAIQAKAVVAAHDLAEGGLAITAAEMAIGGRLGVEFDLDRVECDSPTLRPEEILFSESQSRILLEVPAERSADLRANLHGVPCAQIGTVIESARITCRRAAQEVFSLALDEVVWAFKNPLDLDHTMTEAKR